MHKKRKRDFKDTQVVIRYLNNWNPSDGNGALYNIATGITASSSVNVDNSKGVSDAIIAKIVHKSTMEYSFKQKCQTTTMQTTVKVCEEIIHVHPRGHSYYSKD